MSAVVVALAAAVLLLGVLVVGLLRSHAEILRSLHDLGIHERELEASSSLERRRPQASAGRPTALGSAVVRDITGVTPTGDAVTVGVTEGPPTLLAFLSSGCSTCAVFWETVDGQTGERIAGEGAAVVVITQGADLESPGAVADLAPVGVTTVMSTKAWEDYDVPVSPYFLLVNGAGGIVGEGSAASLDQVARLFRRALEDGAIPSADRGAPTRRDLLRGKRREDRADREVHASDDTTTTRTGADGWET